MFSIKSHHGTSSVLDEMLFNFVGPVLGPLELHGPLNLQGLHFLSAVGSTVLMTGHLLIVGR
jgi:hypothetical protein